MAKPTYFVLSMGPDGKSLEGLTKEKLEQQLNEEYWGDKPKIYTKVPDDMDYCDGLLIIKGEIVSPAPVVQVTKFEVP
jgi:hypothetical protein